jgi:glyoxylase-like metal-dependent hydrolase (beta-lactamase superfamily II)
MVQRRTPRFVPPAAPDARPCGLPYGDPVTNDASGLGRDARLDILFTGYADDRVAGTVSLIQEGDRVIVVDPGMVPARSVILEPLAALGVAPAAVTDVVISHHHPDHTVNIALFDEVPVHDFQAVYTRDEWTDRPADGVDLAPSVRLLCTPGHTPQDLTVLVGTADGVVALTHLWWAADGPLEDPFSVDAGELRSQRERVLAIADRIVPGHGPAFTPGPGTPH